MYASSAPSRHRSWKVRVAFLLLVLALVVAGFSQLGRALYVQDDVQHADALVVLAGARSERWLEAVDLYREGHAPRVVLSPGGSDGAEQSLRARGIRVPTDADRTRDVILQLGVPAEAIVILPGAPDNTAQEATAVRELAGSAGWRRLIVVTSKLHTRRARFAFRREFAGTGIEVSVRASRYDRSDPIHWWQGRADAREVLVESIKLAAYTLGLGG
jgi:uncharacterized SAM-binding protein YcdF (DUF218 family)